MIDLEFFPVGGTVHGELEGWQLGDTERAIFGGMLVDESSGGGGIDLRIVRFRHTRGVLLDWQSCLGRGQK